MKLIFNAEHYKEVVVNEILKAHSRVWIATANVKDMHVAGGRHKSLPLLSHFEKLQRKGVYMRILHGAEPSAPFLNTLSELAELHKGDGFEMQLCPRIHAKIVIVDNRFAYTGSANLTGAGLGMKSDRRRNFECGVATQNPDEISKLEQYFDGIWMGQFCEACGRRNICPRPVV